MWSRELAPLPVRPRLIREQQSRLRSGWFFFSIPSGWPFGHICPHRVLADDGFFFCICLGDCLDGGVAVQALTDCEGKGVGAV